MGTTFQVQLAALGKQVRAVAIPGDWEHTSDCCFGKLPALYEKYCQTNESRYGEEISRQVMMMLNELVSEERDCPEAQKLAARITGRISLLHERFGIPGLALKAPAPIETCR